MGLKERWCCWGMNTAHSVSTYLNVICVFEALQLMNWVNSWFLLQPFQNLVFSHHCHAVSDVNTVLKFTCDYHVKNQMWLCISNTSSRNWLHSEFNISYIVFKHYVHIIIDCINATPRRSSRKCTMIAFHSLCKVNLILEERDYWATHSWDSRPSDSQLWFAQQSLSSTTVNS